MPRTAEEFAAARREQAALQEQLAAARAANRTPEEIKAVLERMRTQPLYARVQADLEADLAYLLEQRRRDPYEAFLPRALVEATWGFTRQAPSFRL